MDAEGDDSATTVDSFLIPPTPDPVPVERVQSALSPQTAPETRTHSSCITCQVRLTLRLSSNWTLESLNVDGNPTTTTAATTSVVSAKQPNTTAAAVTTVVVVPPDEFYVVYHTHAHSVTGNRPIAVAVCHWMEQQQQPPQKSHEKNDTTTNTAMYQLEFVSSPMNYRTTSCSREATTKNKRRSKPGHCSVHFQYTAGIGAMPPPYKNAWRNGGYTQTCYICKNLPYSPTIRRFEPPQLKPQLSSYDTVLAFGDSVLEQLVRSSSSSSSSEMSIQFGVKVATPIRNTQTISNLLSLLEQSHGPRLHAPATGGAKETKQVALILNSALWDVLSDEAATNTITEPSLEEKDWKDYDPWKDHIQACEDYVTAVRAQYPYPNVKLLWLLPTAVHIHRVDTVNDQLHARAPQKIHRTRYMSSSRTLQLYHRQKQLMMMGGGGGGDEGWPVQTLDLYEATYLSADWTLPGDGRHYQPEFNAKMLSWFL